MESRSFIYISLAADLLIALSKFIAAAFTGSAAMIAEGIHSIIDASSQLLLIWGVKISKKLPDKERPFGYGRELYFWSFIVSLIIFIVGGCVSFYEGYYHFQHPVFEGSPAWNYGVLLTAFLFTCISLYNVLKVFNVERGKRSFWRAIKDSKDPSTFITLLGDAGDVAGLVIAFAGIAIGRYYHNPHIDGMASMAIGVMLIIISLILVNESKSLLMGETTSRKTIRRIVALTESDGSVVKVKKHFSMYLAPEEVILQLNTVFKDDLTTHQITDAIERITKTIKKEFPRIKQIFIEPVAADGLQ
ncbi:cation diffusion facilitator family transporter [Mucilaginibacter gotjawali]|uniref:Ferrous iron efflux protein F n=2 Tax=Mucilaginibacter gotjawali TaxID=1550579 RepID=A0A0X8X1T5_9SPHI|nr:cation diffusion facilitator family transporter [Mucilaginibacter gotjawali]MBB3053952.1 cation diffusion facilitator family transporter [Mucilaginibacter gotjawali]BAU54216.1 ferrous iron efflux protein F [Mucilaginibacter gotjawali]